MAELGDFRAMGEIVCVCMGIPKETIQTAIKKLKARDVDAVSNLTSAATGCGSCAFEIEELIKEFWKETEEEK